MGSAVGYPVVKGLGGLQQSAFGRLGVSLLGGMKRLVVGDDSGQELHSVNSPWGLLSADIIHNIGAEMLSP